ncbi:MAG: thiamine diphosphokinase [Treponema sp.]|jgi:thiamine pyrophosphokinase|nr:thiamine diphosphokinase [Treponema sp.]
MRGIAFIGGEGPPVSRRRALAAPGCLIVAADSGLEAAEQAGIRPHWIIGDMDSLADTARLDRYPPDRVIRYPRHKDYTDTELAIQLLWDQGCDAVWLAGGGGGRTDHLLAVYALFERDRPPDRWITAREDIWRLQAGECMSQAGIGAAAALQEDAPDKPLGVSVFPLRSGPWKAESRGLHWPLDNFGWNRGVFGISNAAPQGRFCIRALEGRFLVMIFQNGISIDDSW